MSQFRSWVVELNSSNFDNVGLPWLFHARRFPGVHLFVADIDLEEYQRQRLEKEKVVTFKVKTNVWSSLLDTIISENVILYSSATDLFDPNDIFDKGSEAMVFGRVSAPEYYNLCKPITSVVAKAMTANYIEDKVAVRFDGDVAKPDRVCGPAYLWKVMTGIGNLLRTSQAFQNQNWETLAANLFSAAYPEYTVLEKRTK